jgi:hypothetical protein
MPLIMLDALPMGQAVFNTDDIVTITLVFGTPEIVLRGVDEPIRLPHESVADVAAAIDDFENRVLKGASAAV